MAALANLEDFGIVSPTLLHEEDDDEEQDDGQGRQPQKQADDSPHGGCMVPLRGIDDARFGGSAPRYPCCSHF